MLSQQDMLEAERHGRQVRSIYVYEAPVRLWHWINALAVLVLAVSGYFIGKPLPTMPGEASDNFLMGYIRFAHFAAGYVLAVGLAGRADLACRYLSQGQKRRVALARLVNDRRALWVLDEPYVALDSAAIELVAELIGAHLQRGGLAVLTTHQSVPVSAGAIRELILEAPLALRPG